MNQVRSLRPVHHVKAMQVQQGIPHHRITDVPTFVLNPLHRPLVHGLSARPTLDQGQPTTLNLPACGVRWNRRRSHGLTIPSAGSSGQRIGAVSQARPLRDVGWSVSTGHKRAVSHAPPTQAAVQP
jgi:hypothetical protein